MRVHILTQCDGERCGISKSSSSHFVSSLQVLDILPLEPSLAVWIKSAFGEGSLSTGHILGIGGLTTILGSVISAIVVNAFQDRLWIICIASLCTAGVPLILLKFSLGIKVASVAISVFLFGVHATRFILISMCSTIASSRYPESYGLVFAIVNIGWGVSCLIGPLLASSLFGSSCVICMIGILCILNSSLAVFLRNLDSTDGPNFMDCWTNYTNRNQGYQQLIVPDKGISFTYDQHTIMETIL